MTGSKTANNGSSAKGKGALKKRRRHRAWRREATKEIRAKINQQKVAEGHPGWVECSPIRRSRIFNRHSSITDER
jgi:hypothetical protein